MRRFIIFILGMALFLTSCEQPADVQSIAVESFVWDQTEVNLIIGQSVTLNVTVLPENASNKDFILTSGNEAVVSISDSGTVTALSEGQTTITAANHDNTVSASVNITVTAAVVPVESIAFSEETLSLTHHDTVTVTPVVTPSNATDSSYSFTSSDTGVFTVTPQGEVTAVYPGTATLTVTTADRGKTDTLTITVHPILVTGIVLNKNSVEIFKSKTTQLTAEVSPASATDPSYIYTSSNPSVATVSENGLVTGVGTGNSEITVAAANGTVTDVAYITVSEYIPVTGISFDSENLLWTPSAPGETITKSVALSPSNASIKDLQISFRDNLTSSYLDTTGLDPDYADFISWSVENNLITFTVHNEIAYDWNLEIVVSSADIPEVETSFNVNCYFPDSPYASKRLFLSDTELFFGYKHELKEAELLNKDNYTLRNYTRNSTMNIVNVRRQNLGMTTGVVLTVEYPINNFDEIYYEIKNIHNVNGMEVKPGDYGYWNNMTKYQIPQKLDSSMIEVSDGSLILLPGAYKTFEIDSRFSNQMYFLNILPSGTDFFSVPYNVHLLNNDGTGTVSLTPGSYDIYTLTLYEFIDSESLGTMNIPDYITITIP